ncbi:glycoside hydrolase superfamily [Syncephalastrum racemosum]|uniref:alpha-galactosidase n=1 Tax=Syncephalastrum racemosum TaxID=13706 RepID=A0A1X2H9P5_SYNRA|nr:glycoside hydrolase superfamily [Syncephalastrum racemosum]
MRQKMPQYEYINIDSGWCNTCDEFGRWTFRPDLFPSGLKALADHVTQNHQKLGVYLLPGIRRDAAEANLPIYGRPGHRLGDLVKLKKEGNGFKGTTYMPDEHNDLVQAYYDSIADLLASWNVHYVKIDGCGPGGGDAIHPGQSPDTRPCLRMMHNAFARHGIWMELSWYLDAAYADEWANVSNGARIFVDIESYSTKTMTSPYRVFERITQAAKWCRSPAVGAGFYIDLDAVMVGMTVHGNLIDGLENDDIRLSYISFWALVSSVFCLGADPRRLPDKYICLLNHPSILEIHQSGGMAQPIGLGNALLNRGQVWWKTLPDGRICCGLFNTHVYPFMLGVSRNVTVKLADVGMEVAWIRDAWTGDELGIYTDAYTVTLRPGQCQVLFLTRP